MGAPAPETPLPWATHDEAGRVTVYQAGPSGIRGDVSAIAVCVAMGDRTREEAERNAHYIVTACNAFPELMKRLQSAAERVNEYERNCVTDCDDDFADECLAFLRTVRGDQP